MPDEPELLWSSRDTDGSPCVPYLVEVTGSDRFGQATCILRPNGSRMTLSWFWLHETHEGAKDEATSACEDRIQELQQLLKNIAESRSQSDGQEAADQMGVPKP